MGVGEGGWGRMGIGGGLGGGRGGFDFLRGWGEHLLRNTANVSKMVNPLYGVQRKTKEKVLCWAWVCEARHPLVGGFKGKIKGRLEFWRIP